MPMRSYLCNSCGFLFEVLVRGKTEATTPCAQCKEPAQLKMRSRASVTSSHSPGAPVPQTTGASVVDHEVDWVIAKSAAQNLREMEARQDAKRRIMARENVEGERLSRLDSGEYFVMSEKQKAAAAKARLLHETVVQTKKGYR